MSKHTVFISSLLTISSGCTRVYPENSAESTSASASGGILISTTTAMATSQGSSTTTTTHTGSANTGSISTSEDSEDTKSTSSASTSADSETTSDKNTNNDITTATSDNGIDTDNDTAECHNGTPEGNEQCDDGNELDNDNCVDECIIATCGDGHIRTGIETCDPGDEANEILCRDNCSYCGDGKIDTDYEECDDGPGNGTNLVCSTECAQVGLRAFITADAVSSNLGGIDGANAKCTELAAKFDQKSKRHYRAWLSQRILGIITEPYTSFIKDCNLPIISTTNEQLATSFELLFSEGPIIPINSDEYGTTQNSHTWTRTSDKGEILDTTNISDCGNWAHQWGIGKDASNSHTIVGTTNPQRGTLHVQWTNKDSKPCNATNIRIYCFEQCPE